MENRRQSDIAHALLKKDLDELKVSVAELTLSVNELMDAWKTANGMLRFMKWAATLVAAGYATWLVVKDHLK
jgi:hypothetical protein